jgi:hypothetical protein
MHLNAESFFDGEDFKQEREISFELLGYFWAQELRVIAKIIRKGAVLMMYPRR